MLGSGACTSSSASASSRGIGVDIGVDEGSCQYPKLQLVHIDNAWYALNQSCLQIYQMLQQSGRAQLMPVDIVPLHKLPECIQKSLTSAPDEKANIFRIYDVMSASDSATQRCQLSKSGGSSSGNGNSSSRLVNDKSGPWWSRLFPPKVSHRRQIVQKLIDDVGQRNPRNPSASSAHPVRSFDHSSTPSSSELDSDFSFVCSVCESSFLSHRLLQRHRERANHFGCSICSQRFSNSTALHDHCELLSHWSEDEDDVDSDEFFFSEASDDAFHDDD